MIIPTYNRAHVLPRAIESVLTQTHGNFELIIVDDGSTDNTSKVVESFEDPRIKYYSHNKNQNASAARNMGIRHATGEYIAFLDSDDEWDENKLEYQLDKLNSRDNQYIGVYCGTKIKRTSFLGKFWGELSNRRGLKSGGKELIPDILQMQLPIYAGSTLIVESDIVEEISGFDEGFERHQDYEFLIRLLQNGKLGCVPEPLVKIYESSNIDPEITKDAKIRLFNKFSDEINKIENSGFDVKSPHSYQLARLYFSNSEFREGMRYIRCCQSIRPQQYIPLIWSIIQGIQRRFRFD